MKSVIPFQRRIGFRISLAIAIIVCIGIGLVEIIIVWNEAVHRERYSRMQVTEIENELNHKTQLAATVLAAVGTEALLTYNYTVLDNYAKSIAGDPDVLEVIYRDAKGLRIAGYSRGGTNKTTAVIMREEPIRVDKYHVGSVSVTVGTKRLAAMAASTAHAADARIREASRLFIAVAAILTACVMGGVMFAVNRMIVRPLNDMVRHMTASPEGSVPGPPAVPRKDEIGHLLQTYTDVSLSAANYKRELMMKVEELEASRAELTALNESLERRVAERTQALEETNEEIRKFAYIVSHDLRAPLVSIKGFSTELSLSLKELRGMLREAGENGSPPDRDRIAALMETDVPEALSFIESAVARMDRLISAVLSLSRAGRRELKPERIDMNALTGSLLDSLAHQREGRSVTVTVLPEVVADRLAMEQIMGNLLDNAFKYLDAARPGVIEISADERPDEVIFRVKDNGRGISSDDMPKVFMMFRRAGIQDVPGDGMGLAYVKALVKSHNGRIWCESEPGRGSVFAFAMPRA